VRAARLCGLVGLLTACGGPSAETQVEELRVLVLRGDPPEIGPGEPYAVEGVVADPLDEGFETLFWTCTRLGPDCIEPSASTDAAWPGLRADSAPTGEIAETGLASPALSAVAGEDPLPLIQLYVLACTPGTCPVIDRAAADPDPGSAEADLLVADLADPFTMLEGLPMQGVSLASFSLSLSSRPEAERHQNPGLSCARSGEGPVAPGAEVTFTCSAEGSFDADGGLWGYATLGAWDGSSVQVDAPDPEITYTWIAPARKTGDATLWLVLVDGLGGLSWQELTVVVE
jgi:hypothetical protein